MVNIFLRWQFLEKLWRLGIWDIQVLMELKGEMCSSACLARTAWHSCDKFLDISYSLEQELVNFRIWRGKHCSEIWMQSSAQVAKHWLTCFLPCPSFAEESMKLAMKEQENVENTLERVKDEQPVQKAVEAKTSKTNKHRPREKLFPNSLLFKQWGEDLSGSQQKRAEDLFQKFGYNVYLSNLLPLNRSIPDTRHSR